MSSNRKSSSWVATVLAVSVAAIVAMSPARAADPIFPTGSRLGLVPPAGMVASETFDGFADPGKDAAILMAVLPPTAYGQIEKTLDPDTLKKQGVIVEKREPMQFSFGKGFLVTARQTADKTHYRKWLLVAAAGDFTALITAQVPEQDKTYPDRTMRAALASLSVRAHVPEAEELSLLPFTVGDLAGFHVEGVLRGRGLMLSDRPNTADSGKPATESVSEARLLIAAIPGGPQEPDDRANFAKLSFSEIGGLRDIQITVSEPLRIGGQSGYQTMADAKDARSGNSVRVVQWLRFGGGGYLQMVGIASSNGWTTTLTRMRAVRDSIDTK